MYIQVLVIFVIYTQTKVKEQLTCYKQKQIVSYQNIGNSSFIIFIRLLLNRVTVQLNTGIAKGVLKQAYIVDGCAFAQNEFDIS